MGTFLMRLVQTVAKWGALSAVISYLQKAVGGVFNSLTSGASVQAVVAAMQKYLGSNPNGLVTILGAVSGTVGTTQLLDHLRDEPALANMVKTSPAIRTAVDSYKMLIKKYDFDPIEGPDGDDDETWGVDDDDVTDVTAMIEDSMPLVRDLTRTFGSVDAAERVYMAIKLLEPRHFKLYRRIQAMDH